MVEQLIQTPIMSTLLYREKLDKITSVLKSLANEKRIDILILLDTQSPMDFQYIKDSLQISKTALANHLNILEKEHLIQRVARGVYEITLKGSTFLSLNASLVLDIEKNYGRYHQSSSSIHRDRFHQYHSISSIQDSNPYLNSTHFEIIPGDNSFISGLIAICESNGLQIDGVLLSAVIGMCFINCISIEQANVFHQYQNVVKLDLCRNLEYIGLKFLTYYEERAFPYLSEDFTLDDFSRAKIIFKLIREELDKTQGPLMIFGMKTNGFSLVMGTEGNNYIIGQLEPGKKISYVKSRFDDFDRIPFLCVIIPKEFAVKSGKIKIEYSKIFNNAVKLASGDFEVSDGEYNGVAIYNAFQLLIKEMVIYDSSLQKEKMSQFRSLIKYYLVMKSNATIFLQNLVTEFHRTSQEFLISSAAQLYHKIAENFQILWEVLGNFQKDTNEFDFDHYKQLLEDSKELELKAIKFLKDCTYYW
ncbi:MAG: hypothetical protein ACTSUK_05020 [Promethearchaeota archaeon]